MNRFFFRTPFAIIMLFSATGILFALPLVAQKTRKAVFVIVDGIPADVIEKLSLPNLTSIAAAGGYTRSYTGGMKQTYNETPTISAVGYNSVLTGTWANKHNVWDNDIAAPNYHYPTIFRLLKEQFPAKKTGIFSSWEDNRTKLVGDHFEPTDNTGVDYAFDGLEHDTVHYPHDREKNYMSHIDDTVAKTAAQTIQTKSPDLSWVYLEYSDDMGHQYGDSPQFYNAVKLADQRIGYIWKAIQYRQQHFNEEWLIIITTDHGRDAVNGKDHGGQSDRERSTWIFTNAKNLNREFRAPQASATDIMPSIARFMDISIARDKAFEVDGIPFIGALSFIKPLFSYSNNKLHIEWKAIAASGKLKAWIASSNHFKTGGKDEYLLLGTIPVKTQQAIFSLDNKPSAFYKIVLQGDHNSSNYWIERK
jgi:predicted AlkP superfamily pyrophosphatase or phosphodiesterase